MAKIWKWKRPVFGNRGISWLPGLVIVDGTLPPGELRRVIQNELVHQKQWLECLIIGFPFVYLGLWIWTMFKGRQGYYDHPMELDSRNWDDGNLTDRPAYWWVKVLST